MPRTRRQQQEEEQLDPAEVADGVNGIAPAAAAAAAAGGAAAGGAANGAQPNGADGTAEAGPTPQMDDFSQWPALLTSLTALQQRVANPAVLLQPNPGVTAAARSAIKELHAYACAAAAAASTSGFASTVPPGDSSSRQLHVAPEFDAEQVWLQMELLLAPLLRQCRRAVTQLQQEPPDSLVPPEVDADIDQLLEGQLGEDEEEDDDDEDEEEEEEEEAAGGSSELEEEEDDKQQEQQQRKQKQPGGKKAKKLATEDRFFKLSDMEAFVAQAEREAAGLDADEDEEEDSEEEESDASDLEGEEDSGDLQEQAGRGKRRRGLPAAAADGDIDDEDERRLAALLDDAAAMAGQKRGGGHQQQQGGAKRRKQQQQQQGSDSESGEGEDAGGEDLMYQDFFGDEDEDDSMGGDGSQEDEEEEEPGSSEGEEQQQQGRKHKQKHKAAADAGRGQQRGLLDLDEEEEGGQERQLSTHEKQLLRMQERIRELEEENFGDKPWHLLGEVPASRRPLNSALELDMDFETTSKPPPAPTEEATAGLEEVIKARIREQRWDDVVRVVPPPTQQKKKVLELDDSKASQGLADVYEADYVRAAAEAGGASGGAAGLPDKQEPLRRELRALWGALGAKLDALSAFHYAPKPLVEELEVRSEVPALVMEEVAPLAVSTATLQTPAEAYKPAAHGEAKAEQELTREDRKRRRSQKKRAHKAKEAAAEAAASQKAATEGGAAAVAGRKSLKARMAAAKSSGLIQAGIRPGQKHGKSEFGKSKAAFARIQETRDAAAAGKKEKKPAKEQGGLSSSALKL